LIPRRSRLKKSLLLFASFAGVAVDLVADNACGDLIEVAREGGA
jgi:hypothetical protein